MITREQTFLEVKYQQEVTRRITKLSWLSERFGDCAKYQGFDQEEALEQIVSQVMALALLFIAKLD